MVLSRARLNATILLPVGSEPGEYEVQLLDANLQSRASSRGTAAIVDYVALSRRASIRERFLQEATSWPCGGKARIGACFPRNCSRRWGTSYSARSAVIGSTLAARHAGSARAIGAWLSLCAILGVAFAVFRVFELSSLRARHETGGLASVGLAMLAVHLAHITGATSSTVAISMQMLKGPVDETHFVEVAANARYWYLMVCSWLAFYPIIYLAPRFL